MPKEENKILWEIRQFPKIIDERRTMHDDVRKLIAIGHLSDSGDLINFETKLEKYTLNIHIEM